MVTCLYIASNLYEESRYWSGRGRHWYPGRVSKRRKRKPSRKERRAGIDRPVKRQADDANSAVAPSEPSEPAPDGVAPEPDTGRGPDQGPPEQADQAPVRPTVSATFRPTAKSEATAELEQRYINRDLRRLLIQLAVFALVIAGLAVLDAQTGAVGSLGSSLFKLWE